MILQVMIESFREVGGAGYAYGQHFRRFRNTSSVPESSEMLEDVYEPYLLKCGFIQRTPRGRVVTDLAYRHLGILPPVSR